MAFPSLRSSDHAVVSISIDLPINSKQDALFHYIVYDYSCADCNALCDHLRNVPWEDIFRLSTSAAVIGIDVYIPHLKYQVKLHSSPWFLAACAAAKVQTNLFFFCTNRINPLNLK